MLVKKPILAGIMSLAAIGACRAQKPVEVISETGLTGVVHKEAVYYGGMNLGIPTEKNYTDVFAGMTINSDKKASFLALAMNNYNWTKNISSWIREVFSASKRGANSTLEVSPLRANVNAGNFSMSLNPAYTLYNDFKSGTTTQGINTIFQTTYSITPNDKIFAEAKYTSEPSKNLFDTHFGKLKDNISYMLSYMRNF